MSHIGTIRFVVDVQLDEDAITREGKRHRLASFQQAQNSVVADIECRLNDSIRWRDGVASVDIALVEQEANEGSGAEVSGLTGSNVRS